VGVTAGSREVPGRKAVTRENSDNNNNNNNNNYCKLKNVAAFSSFKNIQLHLTDRY
jgi:hypothetical protein